MSNQDPEPGRSLLQIEAQVEAEMREFGRRRLQEELQKEADLSLTRFGGQGGAAAGTRKTQADGNENKTTDLR